MNFLGVSDELINNVYLEEECYIHFWLVFSFMSSFRPVVECDPRQQLSTCQLLVHCLPCPKRMGENCKRKNNESLQVSLINEREKRREQSLTHSPVPSSRPRPSHSPSNSYFGETYHSLLPNMMLHGMEYPSGQSGAALLAEPLPSLLLTPSLLTGVTE